MGPFVHRIDPVLAEIGGLYLWWYGLSYTLGFLGLFFWFRRARGRLGLGLAEIYDITLALSLGVLAGGRAVEIIFYERSYYTAHPLQIPALWLGGMASHGVLIGATLGTWMFCRRRGIQFLAVADELVIPAAWVMGMGRIGNFIDGQIAGAVTDVCWAVQFPDLEGFRHPVVLYDGAKNLLLIPLFLLLRRGKPRRGALLAHFLLWYAALRIPIDLFREYRVDLLSLGAGQVINAAMALAGLVLLVWSYRSTRPRPASARSGEAPEEAPGLWVRRLALAVILFFSLAIPSDWTQDIPRRYGHRHPGMEHSWLYPPIEPH